jgi:hypothetical protein
MLFDVNTGLARGMWEYISAMGHSFRAEISEQASTDEGLRVGRVPHEVESVGRVEVEC